MKTYITEVINILFVLILIVCDLLVLRSFWFRITHNDRLFLFFLCPTQGWAYGNQV